MKKIFRLGSFETNSSSSHSIIFCTEEEYDLLCKEELFILEDEVITKEKAYEIFKETLEDFLKEYTDEETNEILEKIKKEYDGNVYQFLYDEGYSSYDMPCVLEDWRDGLDHDSYNYTTPKGEKICVICAYGWDC